MDFSPVEQNLRESFRVLAAGRPAGEVRDYSGVTIASSGALFQMFNAAFLAGQVTAAPGELEQRVATAAVHFRARGLGWSFWVCESLIDRRALRRAGRVFASQGLHLAVQLPGMVAGRVLPPRRALPAIDIRRVESEPTRQAFCDIGAICFHVPVPWFREIFLWEPLWNDGFAGFLGYVDGDPVATAATVVGGGAIGVYNVATLPHHRRQGYGEAVMRHAIDAARRSTGIERSILQSTDFGLNLYQSMGYQTVTTVAVYASES
ncbi:MAG: GNAT family N-acetyltransferase [Bryobacteraceae bacterium]